ncbi:MAG: ABC transporter substrate-binding protein [Bacteroidota bacterium]|nr:ABC transporter substrate-binding protein [Bacteroidota bacterium]
MTKQIFLSIFILCILGSCVQERDLTKNTVIAHITSQPDGLHPCNDNSVMRSFIFNYTQKFIVSIDLESLDYMPMLAESMAEISNDGLSYTYRLKEGVKWDNGEPCTAKDLEFSTKATLCHLTNNAQIRSNYSTVIKSIELYEDDPLKFTMHAQGVHVNNKIIIGGITMMQKSYWDPNGVLDKISFEEIISEKLKETEEISDWFNEFNHADNGYQPEKLRGLGPYQVDEWVASQYITLVRKKDWWGENSSSVYNKAYPERIIFKIIKEDASSYLALKSQEIDVTTNVGTVKLMKLQEREYFNNNYDSDFLDQYSYSYIGLNMKPDGLKYKPFFVDQRVRRAMAYLTPIEEIIEVMIHGKASRQVAQISHLKKTYNDTLKLIPLDIEKAKELLTKAGWVDTDGDNIRDKVIGGQKIPFIFKLSYMGSPVSKEIVLMIKESMYKAGIVADPTPMDFTLFYKNAMDHKFEAMLGGWGGSASYSNPMQLWHTSSWVNKGSNFCGFGDAESDVLIEEANTSLDYNKHKDALWKLQAKIYRDQPYVFLYSTKRKIAIHKRFDNRNMYNERPGVMLQNLHLNNNFVPTTVE